MKKQLLMLLLFATITLPSCKKQDDNVPIDMSLRTYSATAQNGKLPVLLQLSFELNGTVRLRAFPSTDLVVLKYEVGDKTASHTTLRIYGDLNNALVADGFVKGTKIDWNNEIWRPSYKPEVVGFTAGKYQFASY